MQTASSDVAILADGCSICFSKIEESGEHVLVSLNCGHVFGKVCVEKWISMSKRCPQCNLRASKRQIRRLYPSVSYNAASTHQRDESLAICCLSEATGADQSEFSELLKENIELKKRLRALEAAEMSRKIDSNQAPGHMRMPSKVFGRSIILDHTDEDGPVFITSCSDEDHQRFGFILQGHLHIDCAFSPDQLLEASSNILRYEGGPVRCMTRGSSGSILFGTTDGRVYLYDYRNTKLKLLERVCDAGIWSLAFKENGEQIYAGDTKGRLLFISKSTESIQVDITPLHSIEPIEGNASAALIVGSLSNTFLVKADLMGPLITRLDQDVIGPSCSIACGIKFVVCSSRDSLARPAQHSVYKYDSCFNMVKCFTLTGFSNSFAMTRGAMSLSQNNCVFLGASECGNIAIWRLPTCENKNESIRPDFIPVRCKESFISEINTIRINAKLVLASVSKCLIEFITLDDL